MTINNPLTPPINPLNGVNNNAPSAVKSKWIGRFVWFLGSIKPGSKRAKQETSEKANDVSSKTPGFKTTADEEETIAETNYSISKKSIKKIIGNSKATMVYGFYHCEYLNLQKALRKHLDFIFNCSLGNDTSSSEEELRYNQSNGGFDKKIKSGSDKTSSLSQSLNRMCKAGLVNLILENYKRNLAGLELIPIIFCIDTTENPHPLTSENMLSKTKKNNGFEMNRITTHSELRRLYKLCHDPKIDDEIKEITQKACRFVKVASKKVEKDLVEFSLEQVAPPWEDPSFQAQLEARREYSAGHPKTSNKDYSWKDEVNKTAKILRNKLPDDNYEELGQIKEDSQEPITEEILFNKTKLS